VKYYQGVPSPVKNPEKMNMVIFRENTEDVYAGIEWQQGTPEAKKVIDFLGKEMGKKVLPDSGIGIKPISITGTKNLVRSAIRQAIDNQRKVVTLVHKGNIMKFTEGAFRDWGYQLAREEFGSQTISEDEVTKIHGGKTPAGKILINDKEYTQFFTELRDQQEIASPLKLTKTDTAIDVWARTSGGGYAGQAGAVKLGIARALKGYDATLEPSQLVGKRIDRIMWKRTLGLDETPQVNDPLNRP
jgi:hypothetical protein